MFKTNETKWWQDMGQLELPTLLMGRYNGTITLENSVAVSFKVKHTLPHNLEIPLLVIYPEEVKIYTYTKTCT